MTIKTKARFNVLKFRLTNQVWEGSCLYGKCETLNKRIQESQEILDEMKKLAVQLEETSNEPNNL